MAFCSFAISLRKNKKGEKNAKVLSVKLEDDNKKLFYALPPLKAVWLNAKVYQSGIRPYYNDPLAYIEVGVIENDKFGIPRADGKIRRNITIDEADEAERDLRVAPSVQSAQSADSACSVDPADRG